MTEKIQFQIFLQSFYKKIKGSPQNYYILKKRYLSTFFLLIFIYYILYDMIYFLPPPYILYKKIREKLETDPIQIFRLYLKIPSPHVQQILHSIH